MWRKILESPIWKNSNSKQKAILIALLLMANWTDNKWDWDGEEFEIMPGQFITSLNSIKELAGKDISFQNIRTALKRFEKLDFLTTKVTNRGRLITIIKWDSYQEEEKKSTSPYIDLNTDFQKSNESGQNLTSQSTSQDSPESEVNSIGYVDVKNVTNKPNNKLLTSPSQALNKLLTSNEEGKKDKKDKKVRIYNGDAQIILAYLNEKKGSKYEDDSFIIPRLKEGRTIQECIQVIDNKLQDSYFIENPKYLCPETLFRKSKFDKYLNEVPIKNHLGATTTKNISSLNQWEIEEDERERQGKV